jgi:hypothetical protein
MENKVHAKMIKRIVILLYALPLFFLCICCKFQVPVSEIKSQQNLPVYWMEHLSNKIELINNFSQSSYDTECFYFLTDYHFEDNAGYSHCLISYLCSQTNVKNLVFGGDVFNGNSNKEAALDYMNEFNKRFSSIRVFGIRGNHDYNLNDGGSSRVMLSDSVIYKYLIGKEAKDVVFGRDSLYYYRDVNSKNLRFIFLDSRYEDSKNSIDNEQLNWLLERIIELPELWSIVIFTHQLFRTIDKETNQPKYSVSGLRTINCLTTIEPRAKIIAIISGHCHSDYSINKHGFWEISTTCDAMWQNCDGLTSTRGTINEHAFDVFCINLKDHTLKATRIGRGKDREWNY